MKITFKLFENLASIHTIEFYIDLPNMTFAEIKKVAFENKTRTKDKTYTDEGYLFVRMSQGVVLKVGDFDTTRAYLKINPRILVEKDFSYLGIFNASQENIEKMYSRSNELVGNYIKGFKLEDAVLCRVDLCLNIESDDPSSTEEQIRCLKRCDPRRDYELYQFDPSQKNYIEKNRHSFSLCSKHYKLTVYDKIFEREERDVLPTQAPNALLRVEFSLQDEDAIADYAPLEESALACDVLFWLGKNSGNIIAKRLRSLVGDGYHFPLPTLLNMIEGQKGIKEKTKRRMRSLVETFSLCTNGEQASRMFFLELPKKVDRSRYYTKLRRKFSDMGVNIVPLSANWKRPLPSLTKIVDEILENGEWVFSCDDSY